MICGHPVIRIKDIREHIRWSDLVHTTMFTTATKTRILSQYYQKPCILTIHEVLGNKWFWVERSKLKALLFKIYESKVCKQPFNAYHVVSDSTKKDYERLCGKDNMVVRIYNSVQMIQLEKVEQELISVKDYFNLEERERSFLYFGRPARNKGVFILEAAVAKLYREGKVPENVRFCWLLAEEPCGQRQMLLDSMERHGIMDKVSVRESVNRKKLMKIISGVDYVIIPSITEGFGFCAVEACTLGKNVIYSSGGSLPEVVFGKCLMFHNMDVDDLAEKLQMVIERGDKVFKHIPEKYFEKDRMVAEMLCLYKRVLLESMKNGTPDKGKNQR